jgi:hypothetical protein
MRDLGGDGACCVIDSNAKRMIYVTSASRGRGPTDPAFWVERGRGGCSGEGMRVARG